MSFMMDDISRPVEVASKNCASCLSTFSNTVLRRSVTADDADIVNQIIAEIIAQSLGQEYRPGSRTPPWSRHCETEVGDKLIEVEAVMENRDR